MDMYLIRLKLLIVMARAQLQNYPMGNYRKKALIQNAEFVAADSVNWFGKFSTGYYTYPSRKEICIDYFLYQRINLLALMVKALAETTPVGYFRTKAIEDNIDYICNAMGFDTRVNELDFLKVA